MTSRGASAVTSHARPLTAVRGAGYTSNRNTTTGQPSDSRALSNRVANNPLLDPKAADQYIFNYYDGISNLFLIIFLLSQARETDQIAGGCNFSID